MEKIWILDELRLSPEFLEAYKNGKAVIHDGVAYWSENSGKSGIIQHLPFKEGNFGEIAEAIKAAQMTTVIAASVSTAIILGAIVIQTRYLAAKLDKIQQTVDLISQDVHTQNILYYMDKVADYFGNIETARSWLKERNSANEIKDIAIPLLSVLAGKRNHLLLFISNLFSIASDKNTSDRHFELILDFVQMMLELTPIGIHVEYLLFARIGKIHLAERTLLDGAERYEVVMQSYRTTLNEIHHELVLGKLSADRRTSFQKIEMNARRLLTSEDNKALLSLPLGQAAWEMPHLQYI